VKKKRIQWKIGMYISFPFTSNFNFCASIVLGLCFHSWKETITFHELGNSGVFWCSFHRLSLFVHSLTLPSLDFFWGKTTTLLKNIVFCFLFFPFNPFLFVDLLKND
jgi:hypothetical protein